MKTVHDLREEELLELRGNYFVQLQETGEEEFLTDESDIPLEAILEHYAGVMFSFDDFWCNQTIKNLILENSGITWNVKWDMEATIKGYMASLPDRELILPLENLTDEVIEDYIQANLDLLSLDDNYFGAWVDGDTVVFDVSQMIASKEEAIKVGIQNNQQAIYGEKEGEIRL